MKKIMVSALMVGLSCTYTMPMVTETCQKEAAAAPTTIKSLLEAVDTKTAVLGALLFAIAYHYATKRHDNNYLRQEEIFSPREGESLLQHIKRIITDRLIGYYMYTEKRSEGYLAEPEYDEDGKMSKIIIKKEKVDYYGLGGWLHANGDKVKYALFIMGLCTCKDKVSSVALKNFGIDLSKLCPSFFKASDKVQLTDKEIAMIKAMCSSIEKTARA